jgi:glycerol-3-phosphate cytidylyltransferase
MSTVPSLTLEKFLYPNSLIKSYKHWHLLLRFQQCTLGSLILICKKPYKAYSDLPSEALIEQGLIAQELEEVLKEKFKYDKINYLMLMMVDPDVHFHIIPRYESATSWKNIDFSDESWPGPPNLAHDIAINTEQKEELCEELAKSFKNIKAKLPEQKKYNRLYTSGCFDIFHHGHLNIIKRSKALCDHLVVGVSTDELILKEKGRLPIIPFDERISILEALNEVDEVVPQVDKNKQNTIDRYKIDAISVGSDWKGKYPKVSCEMEYFDYTPSVSSTILKEKLNLLK